MNAENMNTETEANINQAIDWLQKTGGQIQDFAAEQAPLYCREVVAWEFWSSVCWGSLGIVLLITAIIAIVIGKKAWNEDPWGDDSFFPLFVGAIALILSLAFIIPNTASAIKAKVAPRLVIVEHLRGLNQ